jgi:hypothetical protein
MRRGGPRPFADVLWLPIEREECLRGQLVYLVEESC